MKIQGELSLFFLHRVPWGLFRKKVYTQFVCSDSLTHPPYGKESEIVQRVDLFMPTPIKMLEVPIFRPKDTENVKKKKKILKKDQFFFPLLTFF